MFGLWVNLMGCRVIFLKLLCISEVQENCVEGIDGVIDGDLEIIVLRSEGRVQYKHGIGRDLTNGDFRAMYMNTIVLFKSDVLFSNLTYIVQNFQKGAAGWKSNVSFVDFQ